MGHVAFPRPRCRRVVGRARELSFPDLCGLSCTHCIRKRTVDVSRWIHGLSETPQRVLPLRLPLY